MIEEALFDAEEKMEKAVSVAKEDLAAIRTGRATPAMFNKLGVEYYGAFTPINQVASISIAEARLAIIKPYEASLLGPIETAIRNSDLGVNPSNDGQLIRISLPQLTEERRRDYAKQARTKGEDAKVSIRSVRRKTNETLAKIQKDGDAGEDEVVRAEKELEKVTSRFTAQIDELVKHKETELLEV